MLDITQKEHTYVHFQECMQKYEAWQSKISKTLVRRIIKDYYYIPQVTKNQKRTEQINNIVSNIWAKGNDGPAPTTAVKGPLSRPTSSITMVFERLPPAPPVERPWPGPTPPTATRPLGPRKCHLPSFLLSYAALRHRIPQLGRWEGSTSSSLQC